ncbi:hypothetical protein NOF55_17800 [Rhizobiaceae bacterium BDR2-2]|uniref:Uncharacterized protein n=1 Tax=Ectorhizobium quercum TaxID=2965071 RepID=A0AAE3SWP3_9HYPH|nr:hypothetical protein [Ectorhizobium quercum]MCX8998963.1 hypothetical protein [Ectorhizobium quercum]
MKSKSGLYVIVGILIAAVVGLGIYVYREETKPEGIEMQIGPDGVRIEQN